MKHNLSYYFFATLCCFLLAGYCQAQLRIVPITQTSAHPVRSTASAARTQAMSLPFFDDFSTYLGQPDPALWSNAGVVVNNSFAIDPPSKGFATFDGLRFSGAPYKPNNTTTGTRVDQSATDSLISQTIDLQGLTPSSNVLMSFWWSAQSLGETPDLNDSLVLQWKDRDQNWVNVWSDTARTRKPFRDTVMQISNPRFLHGTFQFRFIAYGRPSGMYDIWNLDYVLIDQNPSYNTRSIRDLAVTRQPKSLLRRYSAMPLDQFLVNPQGELATHDSTGVFNQESTLTGSFNVVRYGYSARNMNTNQPLFPPLSSGADIFLSSRQSTSIGFALPALATTISGPPPVILRSEFRINPIVNPGIPGINMNRNDTIGRSTVLSDYYAYDDGSAEYGIGIQQRQGTIAVRYVLNKPDTLTAVNILFVHVGDRDLTGQTFALTIWNSRNGKPGAILYEKVFPIVYPNQVNRFYTYALTARNDATPTPIQVADTIYVGWRQSSNDLLAVGYDRNSDSRTQQFSAISGGSQWEPNTERQAGSIMIRPVFGSGIVTSTEPGVPPVVTNFQAFPNPSSGILYWNGKGVRRISVQDIRGRMVKDVSLNPDAPTELNIAELPNGLYLFNFQLNQYRIVRKIIVAR